MTFLNNKNKIYKRLVQFFILFIIILLIYFIIIQKKEKQQSDDPMLDKLRKDIDTLFKNKNNFKGELARLNNRDICNEIKLYKNDNSYTINKKRIYLCLKDENNKYYHHNYMRYVVLHEIAHCICPESDYNPKVPHTQLFHNIFQELLEYAINEGIYNPSIPMIENYCKYKKKNHSSL